MGYSSYGDPMVSYLFWVEKGGVECAEGLGGIFIKN